MGNALNKVGVVLWQRNDDSLIDRGCLNEFKKRDEYQ